jgi:hypothetical protein
VNDTHLGHRAVLGFIYLNPTTSYKFTNKGKFWRNCTRGQIAMFCTSLEGYTWSHGRGDTIIPLSHNLSTVFCTNSMHFTLQFSSANDYARVQLVGIFQDFPTMLLSMHQWGKVCSLCNFMILCIWAVSELKAERKEHTIWVIFLGWLFTIFQKIFCWNSLIKTKKSLKIENVLKNFARNQYIYLQHERLLEIFLPSYFEYFQIWLNILTVDGHLSHITKLKKKTLHHPW